MKNVDHEIVTGFPMEGFLLNLQRCLVQIVRCQLQKMTLEHSLSDRVILKDARPSRGKRASEYSTSSVDS